MNKAANLIVCSHQLSNPRPYNVRKMWMEPVNDLLLNIQEEKMTKCY